MNVPCIYPRLKLMCAMLLLPVVTMTGCQSTMMKLNFIRPMERAHNIDKWHQTSGLTMDTIVHFRGAKIVDGTFVFETNGPRAKYISNDGTTVIYDGKDCWVSPANSTLPMPRFHVLTWPWFMISPFKLQGEGVYLTDYRKLSLEGKKHRTAKMTFSADSGDAPDDWYILYADPTTDRLIGQSYIVTYGKDVDEAEKTPKIITYHDFYNLDGVILPTRWQFWPWTEKEGISGDRVGFVKISNLEFAGINENTFDVPADSRREDLPSN